MLLIDPLLKNQPDAYLQIDLFQGVEEVGPDPCELSLRSQRAIGELATGEGSVSTPPTSEIIFIDTTPAVALSAETKRLLIKSEKSSEKPTPFSGTNASFREIARYVISNMQS
jgi:hypothetical protein